MEYLKLIDELIHELSYRVGVPDLKNKEHQTIISEILTEWGKIEEKYRIMSFLTEAPQDKKLDQSKADTEGDDKNYSHIGRGIYVRKGDEKKKDSQKYKKSDSGQLQAITPDEYEKLKGDQGEEGEKAAEPKNAQTAAQAGGEETEQPETGTSLKDPSYQNQLKKQKEVQKQIDAEKNGTSVDKEALKKEREIQKNLSSEQKSARNLVNKINSEQLQKDNGLSDEDVEHIERFKELQLEFFNNGTSEDRKKEIALELVNDFGLVTNRPLTDEDGTLKPVKIYVKKNFDGGKNKRGVEVMLRGSSKWGPSSPMTNMALELNKFLDPENQVKENVVGGKSEKALKTEFEAAAKPTFKTDGKSTTRKSKKRNPLTKGKKEDPNNPGYDKDGNKMWIEDPVVSQIFKKGTVFGDLKESMHSVEGPADEDGNLIPCDTPENQRKHFDFLVNSNESFVRVKQSAQKFINDSNVSESDKDKFKKIIKSIDDYQTEMSKLTDKVPSEEAKEGVEKLNAKLMDDLHNAHPDIASGMAKQFAENAIVSQEIANGEEVYMPSSGTFPGGDKLVVTRNGTSMEAVGGVSVKFGRGSKETQIYGFPGEAQSMANFVEPERRTDETEEQFEARKEDLKTRNGRYVGQEGNLLGVRDDIVTDEGKMNEVLSQSGLDGVVKDTKKLFEINNKIHTETKRWMEEQRGNGVSEESIKIGLQKHLNTFMKESGLNDEMEGVIDRSQLTKHLTGSTDGKYETEDGKGQTHTNTKIASSAGPLEFLGLMTFASSVKEGKGMPSLKWNHQSYENGEYHGETVDPTETNMADLSNWGFQARLWVTSGREGGGMLATGTGESQLKKNPLKNV
jgi:hypothetical protein